MWCDKNQSDRRICVVKFTIMCRPFVHKGVWAALTMIYAVNFCLARISLRLPKPLAER
jgi:hypothetical protein